EDHSPVWIALLPAALLARGRRRLHGLVAGAAGLYAALWAAGPVQDRYLVPALPALLAAAVDAMARGGLGGRIVAGAVVVLEASAFVTHPGLPGRLPFAAGADSGAACFARQWPQFAEAAGAVGRLPPEARVMHIAVEMSYPAGRDALVASPHEMFQAYPPVRASFTPEDLWRRIRRQLRVTHVLYNPPHAVFRRRLAAGFAWTQRDVAVWEACWRAHAREVFRSARREGKEGWYVLYALEPRPAPPPPRAFLPGIEGVLACVEAEGLARRWDVMDAQIALLAPALNGYGEFREFIRNMDRLRNR
ncbi:MAG: hypothetical protein AAB368_15555, partial [bacterium]